MAEWIALDRLLLEARPQRSVGLCDGEVIDHAGFRQRVLAWRAAFAAAEGRDWALYFDDAVAFAAALFGAWHAGKRVFLAADNLPATLQALQPQVSGFAGDVSADYRSLVALDAALDDELQALDERACELCVFTSGSTGQPSAIGKRLDQLAREVEALQAAFGAQMEGVQVHGTVSHQHIYGLLFRVLWPLAAGRLIHPRRFFHEDLVGALAGTDTVLVATPAHLKRLPGQLDWASLHGRLRAVFSSGGPLPEDAARQVRQWLGVAPTEVYGSRDRRHRLAPLGYRPAAVAAAAGRAVAHRRWLPGGGLGAPGHPRLVTHPGPCRSPGRRPLPPAGPGRPHRQDRGTPGVAGCAGTRAARRRRGG